MPRSKRDRVVHLTKTAKKTKQNKTKLVDQVRECADSFTSIYVFKPKNMKNDKLKEIRRDWKESRLFMGKNKVMQHALGKTPESEHKEDLSKLTKHITGNCGILFTNEPKQKVVEYFGALHESHYARSGFKATEDFVLPPGALSNCPASMEPRLRKLGLNTILRSGIITLEASTTVCKKGDTLTAEQCQLLELFEVEMAIFTVQIKCAWIKGEFELLAEGDEEEEEEEVIDANDDEGDEEDPMTAVLNPTASGLDPRLFD